MSVGAAAKAQIKLSSGVRQKYWTDGKWPVETCEMAARFNEKLRPAIIRSLRPGTDSNLRVHKAGFMGEKRPGAVQIW